MKKLSGSNPAELKIVLGIILFAILTRIAIPPFIGHLPNFSPIDAMALFCGAYFSRRIIAFMIVIFSVWVGDLVLNRIFMDHWVLFYSGFYWQYGCYLLITLLGSTLNTRIKPLRLISACLASSVLFFAVSNFGVWCRGLLYPLTLDGLMTCYVAGIPFFKNTVVSDLFFSMVLFGSFQMVQLKISNLLIKSETSF